MAEADMPAVELPGDDEELADVLLGDVLLVEPDPLVDPEADPEPLVDPEADVDGDVEEVEPVLPIVDEPDAPAELIEALVSDQLSSVPCKQPVTVTVFALLLGLLYVELLVPLVPVELPGSVVLLEPLLCVPLCAATFTAKAHANATPVAGPNTRFMWSSSS